MKNLRWPLIVLSLGVATGCVHLPPTVKAELERAERPADNNFAREPEAPPAQAHAHAAK